MISNLRRAFVATLLLALPTPAQYHFNEAWTSFQAAPGALVSGQPISDDDHETDLDWGDLDADGDADIVVVRKQPFTTLGARTNMLLVNEAGVLTERSASLAAASDVPGDQGFLTPTNDRDVVLVDVDGDGLLDVVTAVGLNEGEPKHISHPRVYLNRGAGSSGWQGIAHEDARVPQLLHHTSGAPLSPRFAAVDAGDLDGDGFPELYFGDHDTGVNLFGSLEPPAEDTEDRILQNDGSGFFVDASTAMMPSQMLKSKFCNSVELADFNLDGVKDVLKQRTYSPVGQDIVTIAYNDPLNPGVFSIGEVIHDESPYFVNSGDLNRDGRTDIVITQNADDIVLLNTGLTSQGTASFAPPTPLLVYGGEPHGVFAYSYSSNNLIADLDGDGWDEVLIADVDPEIPFYAEGLRLHLYHNLGGTVGGTDILLREERASTSDEHWVAAPGLSADDLRWTHDVAVLDVNLDTRMDLVLSRREGTQVWLQADVPFCQQDLGFGEGAPVLQLCGGDLSSGQGGTLSLFAAPPLAPAFLAIGPAASPAFLPSFGITVVPAPITQLLTLGTDAAGEFSLPVPGGLGPLHLVLQCAVLDPSTFSLAASNALDVSFLP